MNGRRNLPHSPMRYPPRGRAGSSRRVGPNLHNSVVEPAGPWGVKTACTPNPTRVRLGSWSYALWRWPELRVGARGELLN